MLEDVYSLESLLVVLCKSFIGAMVMVMAMVVSMSMRVSVMVHDEYFKGGNGQGSKLLTTVSSGQYGKSYGVRFWVLDDKYSFTKHFFSSLSFQD